MPMTDPVGAAVDLSGSTNGVVIGSPSALDALRQQGKLSRDRDGRYHLVAAAPGSTGIIGELYHDPNEGT